jgi:hypothetical protein
MMTGTHANADAEPMAFGLGIDLPRNVLPQNVLNGAFT